MGAKTFTLSFDGERVAPYQIKERRGCFHGSLWLGMPGLKRLLDVIEQVRNTRDKSGFFKFLRSNYSTLEVSCLKNKGGRFLEVADYHSGAQRGSIRIPEGSRGKGWAKLVQGLWSFFLGRDAPLGKAISAGKAPVRVPATTNGKPNNQGFSIDPSATSKTVAPITQALDLRASYHISNARVVLDPEAPRCTRKTNFKWNSHTHTLRVTINHGETRQAQWVTLKRKAVGLAQSRPNHQLPSSSSKASPTHSPDKTKCRVNASDSVGETTILDKLTVVSMGDSHPLVIGDTVGVNNPSQVAPVFGESATVLVVVSLIGDSEIRILVASLPSQ